MTSLPGGSAPAPSPAQCAVARDATPPGDDVLYPGRFPPLVPRELPEPPLRLWGRETELGTLDAALAGGPPGPATALIYGPPGAGKTALATWWLYRHRDHAPDGSLHARVGSAHGLLETPHQILARWLRALGMPPAWIPPRYPDRIHLWQAVSATRHLAILIDDAPSAAVIAALRPRTGLAVVTSRRALARRSADITRIRLGLLRRRPAAALLAHEQGGSPAGPHPVGELARVSGGLPLALRCAARLAARTGLPATRFAEHLEAVHAELLARGIPRPEARTRAVIEAAIGQQEPETAHALRLLALCPGPDIPTGLAAAILQISRAQAGAVLDELARAALLDQPDLSRGQLHPLIHTHAREQAAGLVSAADRRAVTGRIMAWYADEAIHAESTPAAAGALPPTTDAASDPTAAQAAQWADRNIPVMITALAAAVDRHEHPAVALRLSGALWPLLRARGCHDEQLTVARLGVQAARVHRDRAAEARMSARTGCALTQLGQPGKAVACLRHAAGMWEQIGDDAQLAATHRAWGQALMALRRPADATTCLTAALTGFEERADRQRDIAVTLIDLGEALIAAGRETEAVTRLRQAWRLLSTDPDPYHQARAQAALGMALAYYPRLAAAHLRRALQAMRRLGRLPDQATILQALGDLAAQEGQPAQARHHYTEALAMLPATHPAGQLLRDSLAGLDEPQPDHCTCYDQEH